jgi:hypothetical protein
MPNGKIHDHPINDLLVYGLHPFPRKMEALVRQIYAIDPSALHALGMVPFDWERGRDLEKGMQILSDLLEQVQGSDKHI